MSWRLAGGCTNPPSRCRYALPKRRHRCIISGAAFWHAALDLDPQKRIRSAHDVERKIEPLSWQRIASTAAAVVLPIIVGVIVYLMVTGPKESVRLAMLPFEADTNTASLGTGLLQDAADRLSRVKPSRVRFTLIPLRDASRNKVNHPEEAASRLGATHTPFRAHFGKRMATSLSAPI